MEKLKIEMLKIYKPISNLDWMNYKLIKSDVTFHHIIKREDGGRRDIENGALLMPVAHQYLHLIEYKDIETYNAINRIFKYINQQKQEPTSEQREIIEYLLKQFEETHKWDKGSKGKLLIKHKYLEREML
ncbi:MAG: HNH endonuclease [Clostridia bacterium]|nr:HNH endonuclease [Clostridia bacterium]